MVSRCANGGECMPGANVASTFSASGSGTRSVTVSEGSHAFAAGFHYHFQPVIAAGSNQLKCHGIDASNVPVKNDLFTVFMN